MLNEPRWSPSTSCHHHVRLLSGLLQRHSETNAHLLNDTLRAQIIAPQPDPSESDAHHQAGGGGDRAGPLAVDVGEEPSRAGSEPDHLPRQTPYRGADRADASHQPRRDPGGAELEDGADEADDANVEGGVPDRQEVGHHLPGQGEDGEVEEAEGEGGEERWVVDVVGERLDGEESGGRCLQPRSCVSRGWRGFFLVSIQTIRGWRAPMKGWDVFVDLLLLALNDQKIGELCKDILEQCKCTPARWRQDSSRGSSRRQRLSIPQR